MTARSRWVMVRDGKQGKRWQLVFPDGRVLEEPAPDPAIQRGAETGEPAGDAQAPRAADRLHH